MKSDDNFIDEIDELIEPAFFAILGGFAGYTAMHVILWVIL